MAYYARLSFNANGGSGAPSPQIAYTDTPNTSTSITIPSAVPTRQYYTFMGWNVNSSAPSGYAAGSSYPVKTSATADLANAREYTTYATWKRKTIVCSYNANGGSGAPTAQTVNMYEWFSLRSGSPTRTGYNFLGWATSATATTAQYQPGGSARFTSNVTLYAVWKKASDTISTSNGTMGTAMTITITRADASYKDTITYQFGSASGTIATKTSNASVSWTPPTSLASEIPNASSGSLVLTCTTYNGNTVVGTSSITVSLSVPQSLAPTASVSFADTDATCLGWGIYVQSRSKLSFTITASGQQGATIASYRTTVNGTQYTGATFTTDVLLYNGSNSYTTVVTDSRGLQTTVTGTFNVVAYSVPSLTLTLCDRDDSDDSQINIEFDFTVASVSNNNDANYRLDYKLKSSSTWTNGTVTSLGGYSGTITDTIAGRDGGDEWDIRINVIDSFQTSSVESEVGVSGNILLNSRHAGGLGLLMKSQAQNQLDIGKPTVHHGAVLEQFGSTVYQHKTSGNYAKVLTFGTDVTVGKNLFDQTTLSDFSNYTNLKNTYYYTNAILLSANTTYTISATSHDSVGSAYYVLYINPSADDPDYLVITNAAVKYPVTAGTPTDITFTTGATGVIRFGTYNSTNLAAFMSVNWQLELGSSATPYEPYVNPSNINVTAPITLEYARTADSSPTRLTINFNRDYSLNGFTSNNSIDAYLHNSATATWDLYIGKANSSDSVEILDFHNPWSNSDMTVEWKDTTISTLPTGYVEASIASIPNTYGDLIDTGKRIYEYPANINLASGTPKTTVSITLPKGIWLLMGTVQFNSNSSGIRTVYFATSSDSSTDMGAVYKDLRPAVNGGQTYCRITAYYTNSSSSTTLYLIASQNSGSTISTAGRIMAVKIA